MKKEPTQEPAPTEDKQQAINFALAVGEKLGRDLTPADLTFIDLFRACRQVAFEIDGETI